MFDHMPTLSEILLGRVDLGLMVWRAHTPHEASVWVEVQGNRCRIAVSQFGEVQAEARFTMEPSGCPGVKQAQWSLGQFGQIKPAFEPRNIELAGRSMKAFLAVHHTQSDLLDRVDRVFLLSRMKASQLPRSIYFDAATLSTRQVTADKVRLELFGSNDAPLVVPPTPASAVGEGDCTCSGRECARMAFG